MQKDKDFIISAKKLGFDGVELNTNQNFHTDRLLNRKKISYIKELATDLKIEIYSISISAIRPFDFHSANKKEFFTILKIVKEVSDVGYKIGAKYLMLPIFRIDHKMVKNQFIIERIEKIVSIAKSNKMDIALESFLSPNDIIEIFNQIDSDYLKICFDVGIATACNYDLLKSIIKLKDRIGYFHIKDTNRILTSKNINADFLLLQKLRKNSNLNKQAKTDRGTYWTVPLGSGDVDFKAIKKALKIIDYKGFLVLETNPKSDPIGNASSNLSLLKSFMSSLKESS